MQLGDLRKYLNTIPITFDHFEMVNGEMGFVDPDDVNSAVFRLDKPIVSAYVDEKTEEFCLFYQTDKEIDDIIKEI